MRSRHQPKDSRVGALRAARAHDNTEAFVRRKNGRLIVARRPRDLRDFLREQVLHNRIGGSSVFRPHQRYGCPAAHKLLDLTAPHHLGDEIAGVGLIGNETFGSADDLGMFDHVPVTLALEDAESICRADIGPQHCPAHVLVIGRDDDLGPAVCCAWITVYLPGVLDGHNLDCFAAIDIGVAFQHIIAQQRPFGILERHNADTVGLLVLLDHAGKDRPEAGTVIVNHRDMREIRLLRVFIRAVEKHHRARTGICRHCDPGKRRQGYGRDFNPSQIWISDDHFSYSQLL